MEYILVLFLYVGIFGDSDSVTVTNIPGFHSKESCMQAGKLAAPLVANTKKELSFVCLPRGN